MHLVAPAAEYVPAAHGEHVAGEVAPLDVEKVPAGHWVGLDMEVVEQ